MNEIELESCPSREEARSFEREERYIVFKRKHLTASAEMAIMRTAWDNGGRTVKCVVVEHDWPEYEAVWQMIEARVSGRTSVEFVERLREPLVIQYAVPLPVAETLQRAANERDEAAALITSQAAEIEGLLDRLAETQMLAMRWMEAHDKLKAGAPYSFPRPSDLPDEVRRLREALEWVAANSTNEGVGDIDFRFVSARRARTALQHEGGGRG